MNRSVTNFQIHRPKGIGKIMELRCRAQFKVLALAGMGELGSVLSSVIVVLSAAKAPSWMDEKCAGAASTHRLQSVEIAVQNNESQAAQPLVRVL